MSQLVAASLISSSSSSLAATFSPSSLASTTQPEDQNKIHRFRLNVSRREAAAAVSTLSAFVTLLPPQPPPATAFSFGISGPKDWLREQKKKSFKFLLAPIEASRNSLRFAYQLLMKGESVIDDKDIEEVRRILTISGRDCVPQDRSSFVSFQAKSGVEVCTFRLVVNNASSLLDDTDPLKLGAEASLDDLIRSFTSLNALTNETSAQSRPERQKVTDALMDTISSLDKFEQVRQMIRGMLLCTNYEHNLIYSRVDPFTQGLFSSFAGLRKSRPRIHRFLSSNLAYTPLYPFLQCKRKCKRE